MEQELGSFSWTVAEGGYQWISAKQSGSQREGRWLTSAVPLGQQYGGWRYNTLAETGLFRDFADLGYTEDSIREFANRWGLLGGAASASIGVAQGPKERSQLPGRGEPLHFWVQEVFDMRTMVRIWDLVQSRDSSLSEFIKWSPEHVRYEGPQVPGLPGDARSGITIASIHNDPETFGRFQERELFGPAQHLLQREVNRKLLQHQVTVRLLWDPKHTRMGLYMVPLSLVGCLWFQFARAIDGNRDYRRCLACRKWFEITSYVSRKDRLFCSPTCKARAHKQKIAEARRLSNEGMEPRAIAKMLDTPLATIKGWLK